VVLTWVVVQMAVDARRADHALHDAEGRLAGLQAAVVAGDDARAALLLRGLQSDAETADQATNGVLWDLGRRLPGVGRTVGETTVLTRSVRQLADHVLPQLLVATTDVRPLAQGAGARVDLVALRRSSTGFAAALEQITPVVATLDGLPAHGVLPALETAKRRLSARVHTLADGLRDLAAASRVGPAMLGADGPRHYFVGFQNNAESRGTGGLLGAYAVVTADHGRLTVDRLGSDRELEGLPPPRRDLGPDFERLYGHDSRLWQNANMSGHFPYAAQLWLDMWQQRTGQRLDGAVATDPVALGYVLGATGPVRLPDGRSATAANVVSQTDQEPYLRYADDHTARKAFLVGVARAVLDRLLGPQAPAHSALVRAVAHAAAERRFMLYSARPSEQAVLAGTAVAAAVPDLPGPFAFLVVNNAAANKIDYYLQRSLRYDLGSCRQGARPSTVTAVLRNDVPNAPLPRYVAGRLDRGPAPAGSTSLLVSLYVAHGAALRDATVDGVPVAVFPGRERGHPVFVLRVELPRAQPRTIVLHLVEPAVRRAPVVPVQPLVQDQSVAVHDDSCA
jgi:hypothetical protein